VNCELEHKCTRQIKIYGLTINSFFVATEQVQIGLMPVVHAEDCAKAIVDAACRGDRYVTQPAWFRGLYLLRVFAPELMEWWFRVMYVTGPGKSDMDAPSKKILDMTGAKHILYPSSIQTAEHKED